MVRLACDVTTSVSVDVTAVASDADAVSVFAYEFPVADAGTVPANWSVTWEPAASVVRVQVLVAELKVTPEGRFGLERLVKPWVGRVSATYVGRVRGARVGRDDRVCIGATGDDGADTVGRGDGEIRLAGEAVSIAGIHSGRIGR